MNNLDLKIVKKISDEVTMIELDEIRDLYYHISNFCCGIPTTKGESETYFYLALATIYRLGIAEGKRQERRKNALSEI